MRVVEVADGQVVLELLTAEHHRNLQGLIHGGVIATLADTAAGLAMRSMLDRDGVTSRSIWPCSTCAQRAAEP